MCSVLNQDELLEWLSHSVTPHTSLIEPPIFSRGQDPSPSPSLFLLRSPSLLPSFPVFFSICFPELLLLEGSQQPQVGLMEVLDSHVSETDSNPEGSESIGEFSENEVSDSFDAFPWSDSEDEEGTRLESRSGPRRRATDSAFVPTLAKPNHLCSCGNTGYKWIQEPDNWVKWCQRCLNEANKKKKTLKSLLPFSSFFAKSIGFILLIFLQPLSRSPPAMSAKLS